MSVSLRALLAAAALAAAGASAAAQTLETAPQKAAPAPPVQASIPPADRSQLPLGVWQGTVVHSSAQSVRVHSDREQRDLTFLVLSMPHNLWSENGITTYAMDRLTPGVKVRVVYTHVLGIRKAKAIYVFGADGTAHRIRG